MFETPILTIAIPAYNMGWCLEKNLTTYVHESLVGKLEVLCINNASDDNTWNIIEHFASVQPAIFKPINRIGKGYGGAINEAMSVARGKYFRIVDADDWVNTMELVRLIHALENCETDIVLTDYQVVNMKNQSYKAIKAGDFGITYNLKYDNFLFPKKSLPGIHCMTYKMALLRRCNFLMQDDIMFTDEEFVVLPYLEAKSVIYYELDITRYLVSNPTQSTSPYNRGRLQEHREAVLKRLIREYYKMATVSPENLGLEYCHERISRGIGDHFTTLYMYYPNKQRGKQLASVWRLWVMSEASEFWPEVRNKVYLLRTLSSLHVTLKQYERIKRIVTYVEGKCFRI